MNASDTTRPGAPPPLPGPASASAARASSSLRPSRAARRRSMRSRTHGIAALASSTV